MTSPRTVKALKWLSHSGVLLGITLIMLGVAHIQSAAMAPGYEPLVDVCLLIGGFLIGSFSYVAHRYYKAAAEPHNQLELEVSALLQAHENPSRKTIEEKVTKN